MKISACLTWLLFLLTSWWAALLGQPAQAQAPLPPGGAPLREVTRLERVAEPPGGLIPYRAGQLWGYVDTTGRVVIRPCIKAGMGAPAVFFTQGFALLKQFAIEDCLPAPSDEPYRLLVLNTRGEVLRVRGSQAALRQPGGSLLLMPRWQAYGQVELAQLDSTVHSGFSDSGWRRVVPGRFDEPEPGPGDSVGYQPRLLGAHRGTRANAYTGARMARERSPDHSGRWQGLYALTDRQGRLLTSYQFVSVDSFYEGRARVVLGEHQKVWGSEFLVALSYLPATAEATLTEGGLTRCPTLFDALLIIRSLARRHASMMARPSLGIIIVTYEQQADKLIGTRLSRL